MRRFTQATVVPGILNNLGKDAVSSVQFLPGGSLRASFSASKHKVMIDNKGRFNIGKHECTVQAIGPPQVDVYVHYYPFEAPDVDIRNAMSKFGQIKNLRYQSFPGYPNVKTGSRIVKMVVEREIPSQLTIRGYPCRFWYKGQPVRCNICRDIGHLAASCTKKGLCRRCKEPGRTAGQCVKAWNTAQVSVLSWTGPSTSGVLPLAPDPLPQRAASEHGPQVGTQDPFEETKQLLAEAMETQSVASDDDYIDSEVDEEASDNDISDYDTSEEDHLMVENLDLSFGKTRSATKRAKRVSPSQDPGALIRSGAPFLFSEAAEPAAAAAPLTPSASVAQSSALQCASDASSLNPLNEEVIVSSDNNVAGDQNKDSTLTMDNSSKNDGVNASKDELKCSSSVNKTGSINKTGVNKSNEASAMEGTTIPVVGAEMNPVENDAGLAVATVLVPPSEPPGSLPSGTLPEAAGSLEPLEKSFIQEEKSGPFQPYGRYGGGPTALSDAAVLGALSKVIVEVFPDGSFLWRIYHFIYGYLNCHSQH